MPETGFIPWGAVFEWGKKNWKLVAQNKWAKNDTDMYMNMHMFNYIYIYIYLCGRMWHTWCQCHLSVCLCAEQAQWKWMRGQCACDRPWSWQCLEEHKYEDPKDGQLCLRRVTCKSFFTFGYGSERQTEPSHSWFPPLFSSGLLEPKQRVKVNRMIEGIGNVPCSTYQILNG